MMLIGLVSVSVGLWLLELLGAPRDVFALMAAMVAGRSRLRGHFYLLEDLDPHGLRRGTVVSLAILVKPAAQALAPLIVITGWARVVLRDQTLPQVVGGALVGATVAVAVLILI
jgi:hypothetical protein